jgi:hypothetical protein
MKNNQNLILVIPVNIYQNILAHLSVNAETDAWAKTCLEQLKKEVKTMNSYQ